MDGGLASDALQIIARLRQTGHLAYWVGGCVRDRLMGHEPRDYDIVTDATPQQIQTLFSHTIPIGAAFGTVLVVVGSHQFEVSAFRGSPSPDPAALIRADAAHRDFTINALMADPETDRVFDFVDGRADLDRKIIRAVGDPRRRFAEDPLRLVRAVRFAVQLGFTIEPETETVIRSLAADAILASPERIHLELLAILLSPSPASGFQILHRTGLLHALLPEVAAMEGVAQPPEFHPEGDVWTHTLLMLERMAHGTRPPQAIRPDAPHPRPSPELALAVLLHDIGKPRTFRVADRIRFDRHCEVGVEMVQSIAARYRWPGAQTERVCALVQDHLTFLNARAMRRSTLVRWLRRPHFPELLELHRLDCLGSHGSLDTWEFCRDQYAALPPEQMLPSRLLTGEDLKALGYAPGPRYREILTAVEDAQIEGTLQTAEAARAWVQERFPLSR
jgi:poly(A) polymerase